jgi:hypothetical protein
LPYVAPDPFKQCTKFLAKPRLPKLAPGDFPIKPCRNISGANVATSRASAQHGTHGAPSHPNQALNNESQQILSIQVFTSGGAAQKPRNMGNCIPIHRGHRSGDHGEMLSADMVIGSNGAVPAPTPRGG